MSLDGKSHVVSKAIDNDRPIVRDVVCVCGGGFYAAPGARFATCSNGEVRCTVCKRIARRFGRNGFTCGFGCTPGG